MMTTLVCFFISLTIFYILNGQKKIKEIIDNILQIKTQEKNITNEKNNLDNKLSEKDIKKKEKKEKKRKKENEKKEDKEKNDNIRRIENYQEL